MLHDALRQRCNKNQNDMPQGASKRRGGGTCAQQIKDQESVKGAALRKSAALKPEIKALFADVGSEIQVATRYSHT